MLLSTETRPFRWQRLGAIGTLLGSSLALASCSSSANGGTGTGGGAAAGTPGAGGSYEPGGPIAGATGVGGATNQAETGQATGGLSTVGGSDDTCQVASTTAVAWTDKTAMGTPEELFSNLAGTCQAPFTWDGSGWSGTLIVEPVKGQSTITATVELDQSSARWVEQMRPSTATGSEDILCPAVLEVDATVTLELPEGKVADKQRVTLSVSDGQAPLTMQFALDEADFGTWVSIQKADDVSPGMSIQLTPIGQACSGEILVSYTRGLGNISTGAGGPLAAWSDNRCGVGQSAVRLDQPFQGLDLASAVNDAFHQAEFSGAWEDGGATTLSLAISLPQIQVCADALSYGTVVTIPVGIVSSTADNRVRALSGMGTVRATVIQGSLSELQLWLSTDLLCQSPTDTLAYASADCETVQKVTAQLGINRHPGDPKSDEGRLELYVSARESDASPGAAGRVDRLQLSP